MSSAVRRAFRRIELPRETDVSTTAYMNHDTRPLPPSRRTYGPWQFVGLWVVTGSFNIGGWTTGSALIALGLNVWQAMLTVIIGHCLVGLICVLTGAPGAKWHIGFCILQKSSWGMWGAFIPMVQRIMLSFIWYSTQVYWGGQCVRTFISSIWPSFNRLDKPLADGTMTVADFTGFIIFSLLCLPLIYIRPERYHIPFAIAALTVIPTVVTIFIYCLATFGIAVAQNALSNGIDLSALAPRLFNLRRGGYLTAACAFILQPWRLMNGASKFLTVMGGYGVFLGSMTGVMFADYYFVRGRRLRLTHLYELSPQSSYWYWRGVNFRAVVAWVLATWPLMPGFVWRVEDPTREETGWSHLYYMAWPAGLCLAMAFYWSMCRIWPVEGAGLVDDEDYFGTFGEGHKTVFLGKSAPTETSYEVEKGVTNRQDGAVQQAL
ncbi:hypothetical protein BN1723_010674 [Verticillium longisporum]|uniref:Uracil permease n=1 Tax=Verticillium longisporum TaxID=100787 RepID=A0A0G4L0G4_VERLO|nr:hypothetical protein BN1723_010674 [Verticillium longisporum]